MRRGRAQVAARTPRRRPARPRRSAAIALDLVEDVVEDRADERLLGREAAVQRALADAGAARDLLDADVQPGLGERGARGIQDAGAVASCVGPQRADVGLHRQRSYTRSGIAWGDPDARSRPTRVRSVRGPWRWWRETEERPWLDELNDEQRAAATHAGGPLLILAGAGTGKTTTLCARVAWLVSAGVPSERILLLTFTRRASREMLQRARGLVPASSRVLGGTFHSVAHRLVRRHAAALGLPGGFGVLDAGDAADVLDLLREEHGHAQLAHALPEEGDAAGHLLAHGQRAAAAVGRDRGALPVGVGAPRGDLGAVPRLHGAQARARA